MNERSYLNRSILLCGKSDNGNFLRTYHINKMISAGASAVCYEAYHDNSGMGILKEFYPLEVHSLVRDENGQLICREDITEENKKYEQLLNDYLQPYQMMLDIRSNAEISSFIPPFEIFYGCDKNGEKTGTVYIWSPTPVLETFGKICEEIHNNPTKDPEYSLLKILYSICSLVKCVCTLHSAGLVHRDINPNNFGFVKFNKEVLTQNITLFDIDTICSVYNVPSDISRGTGGYAEPKFESRKANNLTDIYAIGATLFSALIINDEVRCNKYLFCKEYYPKLKKFVDTSELIQASEVNSHPHLRAVLTKILNKTLCSRNERYQCCEELLEDLRTALYYVVPAELANRGREGEEWILTDNKLYKTISESRGKKFTSVIQYHLYKEPLYKFCSDDKETLDILVTGLGQYGTLFLDNTLQIMQAPIKRLRVMIISDGADDRDVYMSNHPELGDFFNIDGALGNDPESYGDIIFEKHTFSVEDHNENIAYLTELFAEKNFRPDYAFTAAGKDSHSLFIAHSIERFCRSGFTWNGGQFLEKELGTLLPVCMNEDISKYPFFAELDRMAFNVHLIWNKNLNVEFNDVRKEFRLPYNYNSCVSFVLAMKYKLHGIGIDIDDAPITETAKKYQQYISANREKKDMLVYYEHRRWVTEKLCDGYRRITDLNECAEYGTTRDKRQKRHVCIVRSSSVNGMLINNWVSKKGRINKEKWDSPTVEDLEKLDDLERMSAELHLVYLKHARIEENSNIFTGDIVSAISDHIECDVNCVIVFKELITCMNDIWNNDTEQCRRYRGLMDSFVSAVKASEYITKRSSEVIVQLAETLEKKFYPIWASREYRNYKNDDINLVAGIPFILTYSDSLYMVIPFVCGRNNDDIFANLAAPTVVNPSKIIYLAYCENTKELENIRSKLPYIANYMNKKKFRAGVEFIIGCEMSARLGDAEDIEKEFRLRSDKRVVRVKLFTLDSEEEFLPALKDYLDSRSENKSNFLIEFNKTNLSGKMQGSGMFSEFSAYKYDSQMMQFKSIHDCDIVYYIKVKPFITVTDMFSLKRSTSTASNKPEFYDDHKELWGRYCSSPSIWKNLCTALGKYSEDHDELMYFKRSGSETNAELHYIVPFLCRKTIEKILCELIKENIAGEKSCIRSLTTQSCHVVIHDLYNNKKLYDSLFSKPDILVQTDFVHCRTDPKHHVVRIIYNNLSTTELECKGWQHGWYDLLKFFHSKKYLINLVCIGSQSSSPNALPQKVSFTYATPQIKDLMTVEGRMLEIYTYHIAKETGRFDDIRSSFEIDWEDSSATNEFDCIITKGFSSLFIECKARTSLEKIFYDKISQRAQQFGINTRAVLIADTQESDENMKVIKYGEQLGVITVTDRAKITSIGNTLLNILNGNL